MNLLPGRGDPDRNIFVADGLGDLPLQSPGDGRAISVRPHALTVAAVRDDRRIWFEGEVKESEFLGEFTRYEVRVGQNLLTADTPHLSTTPIYPPGSRVQVGIDPAELRLLPYGSGARKQTASAGRLLLLPMSRARTSGDLLTLRKREHVDALGLAFERHRTERLEAAPSASSARVAPSTRIAWPVTLVCASSRAARFTASPTQV